MRRRGGRNPAPERHHADDRTDRVIPRRCHDRGNHFLSGHPHVDLFKGGSGAVGQRADTAAATKASPTSPMATPRALIHAF